MKASAAKKIILFEMNEVPFRIIDEFVKLHPASQIADILARSKQLDTVCEDQIELDPWISWSTLHRGVIDQDHRVWGCLESFPKDRRAILGNGVG